MGITHDIRYSARRLRHSPLFTVVAALSLAVGIGASTTVFSLVEALLLRDLPGVRGQDRLVSIHRTHPEDDTRQGLSLPHLRELAGSHKALAGVTGFTDRALSLRVGDETRLVLTQLVTGNYFQLLGTRPELGRFFATDTEATLGDDPVAVISHSLWRNRLGADPDVIGRDIHVNGRAFTVIGVAEERFGGTFFGFVYDLWIPASMISVADPRIEPDDSLAPWLEAVGRLAPGVTNRQALAELESVGRQQARAYPSALGDTTLELHALTGYDPGIRGPLMAFLAILFTVTLLVLLMASLNVAGMLLARAAGRTKVTAIQLALGIGRSRLIRQMLSESLLLASLGGIVGLLLARFGIHAIRAFEPPLNLPLVFHVEMNDIAFLFAFLMLVLTGIAAGIVPALRASNPNVVPALQETAVRGGGRSRLRRSFVVAQVAVSLVLLVVTGLFLRTLQHAANTDLGFSTENLSVLTLDARILGHGSGESAALYEEIRRELETLPGVTNTTLSSGIPLGIGGLLSGNTVGVQARGIDALPGQDVIKVEHNSVGPGYLELLDIKLLAGREFEPRDGPDDARVVVVNSALSERLWPAEPAVGQILEFEDGSEGRVVGVAETGKYRFPGEDSRPFVYLAYPQQPSARARIAVRHPLGTGPSMADVRRVVRQVAPDLPVLQWESMDQAIAVSLLPQRMAAWIAGSLGVVGLVLTALGVYGVVAYTVNARAREFGLRMCLGASRRSVMVSVLGDGLGLAVAGIVVGLVLAFAATRFVSGIVFGVGTLDLVTFVSIPILLILVALVASGVPARRVTGINPAEALRAE